MTDEVQLVRDGAVARILLNRPKSLNALSFEMIKALRTVTAQIASDSTIRAVTIRGAGGHFMAGGDVAWFARDKEAVAARFHETGGAFHEAVMALKTMPKPVLAIVEGACAGGGLSLMLACDLAIAVDTAIFTVAYANIGTSPDGGSTFSLPRIVGSRKALELTLLPDRLSANEAKDLHMINWVVPAADLEARSEALVQRLANGPTRAHAHAKRLIAHTFDTSMETQLAAEVKGFADCASGPDFKEGVTAFVEKRKPTFIGH